MLSELTVELVTTTWPILEIPLPTSVALREHSPKATPLTATRPDVSFDTVAFVFEATQVSEPARSRDEPSLYTPIAKIGLVLPTRTCGDNGTRLIETSEGCLHVLSRQTVP
jgi:hypothetical protein